MPLAPEHQPVHAEGLPKPARVFGDHRPARTTVAVAALPMADLKVEIDVVAYRP